MPKFRKKPVVIDAIQFVLGNEKEIIAFIGKENFSFGMGLDNTVSEISIPTLEGRMTARLNDWIIKGVKGEFYPIKDDIFKETYEPAEPRLMEECPDHPNGHRFIDCDEQGKICTCGVVKGTGKKPSVTEDTYELKVLRKNYASQVAYTHTLEEKLRKIESVTEEHKGKE